MKEEKSGAELASKIAGGDKEEHAQIMRASLMALAAPI